MRVAMLTEWWPDKTHEGLFVKDQVDALRAHHDMQVVHVPPARGLRAWRWARFSVQAARAFRRLHAEKPFDLIHSHEAFPAGWLGNLLGRWYGIPTVITQHCWPLPCSNEWPEGPNPTNNRWPEAQASRKALEEATEVIAVSNYLRDRMERGCVIPLVIDRRFKQMSPPEMPPYPFRRRFLFVGSFCHRKGVDAILDAIYLANKLGSTGWEFILHGHGPMWEEVILRTGGIPGVRVEAPTGRERVLELMDWCDVFVFPSRGEGFGLAGVEAAVAGRPVIVGVDTATDLILVSDGNAVRVDGAAIMDKMFGPLKMPDRGFLYQQFHAGRIADQITTVYERAVMRYLNGPDLFRQMEASR